jgi:hypothetical protein
MMRLVHLNPIEPGTISGRTTAGYDCQIDIVYRNAADQTYRNDLAGTLVLTGRTTTQNVSYVVPATDLVNGKARVVIPGADLKDPNGYAMTLVGTIDGVRSVIAKGTLVLTEEGIPELDIVDVIDTVDLTLDYNEDCALDVTLWEDAAGGTPYDLTDEATTVLANVFDRKGGGVLMPFTVTVTGENSVALSLTVDQVNTLPATCWWNMQVARLGGTTVVAEGNVTVTGTITPPLVTSVFNYNYSKPATFANPTSGQVVQGTNTMSHLQVHRTDNDAVDRSATLALVKVGDTIKIGVTTWTVGAASLNAGGWYVFEVLPISQAAVSGVTPVTFARP